MFSELSDMDNFIPHFHPTPPQQQQPLFIVHTGGGLTFREIALSIADKFPPTHKQQRSRIRNRLENRLSMQIQM